MCNISLQTMVIPIWCQCYILHNICNKQYKILLAGFCGVLSVLFAFVNRRLRTWVNITLKMRKKTSANDLEFNLNLLKHSLVTFLTTECCINVMKNPNCKLLLQCIQMVIFTNKNGTNTVGKLSKFCFL